MTAGVGGEQATGDVDTPTVTPPPTAVQTPTLTQPRELPEWHVRFLAAFGGAVVVVWCVLAGNAWQEGLRASTFEELRADIEHGVVSEWYVSDQLYSAPLDSTRAQQSGTSDGGSADTVPDDGTVTDAEGNPVEDGTFRTAAGDPIGGMIVWRSWGHTGWQIASTDSLLHVSDDFHMPANEQSAAMVAQLREAGVPMRPNNWDVGSQLDLLYVLGALLLTGRLVAGPAPRVGTRWFWFWVIVLSPASVGAVVYAVMELMGFRRRPDGPLERRLRGGFAFLGCLVLSIVVSAGLAYLRSRGVPFPI